MADDFYKQYRDPEDIEAWKALRKLAEEEHYKVFSDGTTLDEEYELVKRWYQRTVWTGRTVLSTEQKLHFDVKVPGAPPWTYVMDRKDRLPDGSIEVVDYKTNIWPIQADELAYKIQPRIYALAAQIEHPEQPGIWVVFDLLRYQPVGRFFSKEESADTWRYLRAATERVLADDGTRERLNDTCRFCVRRHACPLLARHVAAGGVLSITDPVAAADRRAELHGQAKAIETMLNELDQFLLDHCEREGTTELVTDQTRLKVAARKTRFVDTPVVARTLGPDIVARFSKLGIGAVDQLLKQNNPTLNAEQKAELKKLIRDSYGGPHIQTRPVKQ